MIPLAAIELFVIMPRITPWISDQRHPIRSLLILPVTIGLVLLMVVQSVLLILVLTVLWRLAKGIWSQGQAEADAAFASLDSSRPEARVPQPTGELAAVVVEWVFPEGDPDQHGHPDLFEFDVYMDDRPVWTVTGERWTPVIVSEGRHRIFIKVGYMKSEEVEVDLAAGGIQHLTCGLRPMVLGRFFRSFRFKVRYIMGPAALVAVCVPDVMRFICGHFRVELFATAFILVLFCLLTLPRYFSRRPGAMIYLVERHAWPGSPSP